MNIGFTTGIKTKYDLVYSSILHLVVQGLHLKELKTLFPLIFLLKKIK